MTFSRRSFLASASAAIALPRSSLAQGGEPDAVVIGAGMSGLAAASELQRRGKQVVVLEAGRSVGGRIWADRSLGAPVEMGASWIHGPRGNPITKLAKRAGQKTLRTDDDRFLLVDQGGTEPSLAEYLQGERLLEKGILAAKRGANETASLEARLRATSPDVFRNTWANWSLGALIEFGAGGPIDRISARHLFEEDEFAGADVILPNGYDRIPAYLAKGLDIRFNVSVSGITIAKDHCAIATTSGTIRCKKVVCTVPLGVLKANGIRFSPPLPDTHRAAIERLGFGLVSKLALAFPQDTWPQDYFHIGVASPSRGRWPYMFNHAAVNGAQILTAVATGNYALQIDSSSTSNQKADVMDLLRAAFGTQIPRAQKALPSRWRGNKRFRGSYSFAEVGARPEHWEAFKPVQERLFFAGEHTIWKYHSTVHGAYLSGIRAAGQAM